MNDPGLKRKLKLIKPNSGRNSPHPCMKCKKVTPLDRYRYGSTGVIISKCSECGKRIIG